MPEWKQLVKHPAGAFPAAAIQKVGIAALTLVMIGLVLSSLWTGDSSVDGEALPGSEPGLTGAGQVAQLTSRLTDLQDEQQRQQERDAAAAREAAQAEQADALAALLGGGSPAAGVTVPEVPPAGQPGDASPGNLPPGAIVTPDEIELRERLRLEGVERRARSLRAPALVQSFREAAAAGGIAPAAQTAASAAQTPAPVAGTPEGAIPAPDSMALLNQITDAASAAAQAAGGAPELPPWERTVPGVTGPAVDATANAAAVVVPHDPPGWERVYEGSVFSAVLVTQLSGDFAGPVQAQVSIPFYSADRQRIIVPRGARFLGTVQPVRDQDQSRLAVGFHRLVWPDGQWVDLAFHGLNAVGEGALLDDVNRHYVSMFAAAGAVGAIAGLTLQGAGNPYEGGRSGFQSGVSQGLGQSSSQILDRFLNRFPSITIRAGHRLRIWLTADFLMPRPAAHPERLFR